MKTNRLKVNKKSEKDSAGAHNLYSPIGKSKKTTFLPKRDRSKPIRVNLNKNKVLNSKRSANSKLNVGYFLKLN